MVFIVWFLSSVMHALRSESFNTWIFCVMFSPKASFIFDDGGDIYFLGVMIEIYIFQRYDEDIYFWRYDGDI